MKNLPLFIFLFVCNICSLINFVYCSSVENSLNALKNRYGEDYGTEWIYFLDTDGNLHYINLTMTDDEICKLDSTAPDDVIEYRLYNKNDSTYLLLDNQGRAVNASQQVIAAEILYSNITLKLITHGWKSSADLDDILKIKNAYFQVQNVNVITVDWSSTAGDYFYHRSARKTQTIGQQVALFLDALYEEYNVTGDQLHLIGHSLGAHVMGMAASYANRTVHRVTGLDPAGPFFTAPFRDPSERLNSLDAEIVDVIHTCAWLLGYGSAIGTVDFYPNEGKPAQPGCARADWFFMCSHSISYHYFLQSIKEPKTYRAYECASWQDFLDRRCNHNGYMGDSVNENMTGTYYLTTDASETYHFKIPDKIVIY